MADAPATDAKAASAKPVTDRRSFRRSAGLQPAFDMANP